MAGRFVWYDLMTTDPDASREFYSQLFGWGTSQMDMGEMGLYTMVSAGEQGLGGIVPLGEADGVPSHWIAYISVDDLQAACRRVKELGGEVCVPPTDIPNEGQFAVVNDPSGAIFSPFKSSREEPPETDGPPAPGTVCWNELQTTDPEGVVSFYRDLFGWGLAEMDMGPNGKYWLFKRGTRDAGGMMKMPPEAAGRPNWLPHFAVEDVDASTAKAMSLGGTTHVPPTDVPDIGRFSVLSDSTGATFALFAGTT